MSQPTVKCVRPSGMGSVFVEEAWIQCRKAEQFILKHSWEHCPKFTGCMHFGSRPFHTENWPLQPYGKLSLRAHTNQRQGCNQLSQRSIPQRVWHSLGGLGMSFIVVLPHSQAEDTGFVKLYIFKTCTKQWPLFHCFSCVVAANGIYCSTWIAAHCFVLGSW